MSKLKDPLQLAGRPGAWTFRIVAGDQAREDGRREPGASEEDDECGCEDVLENVVAILDSLEEWQKSRE